MLKIHINHLRNQAQFAGKGTAKTPKPPRGYSVAGFVLPFHVECSSRLWRTIVLTSRRHPAVLCCSVMENPRPLRFLRLFTYTKQTKAVSCLSVCSVYSVVKKHPIHAPQKPWRFLRLGGS
jgi:hypothetical protein